MTNKYTYHKQLDGIRCLAVFGPMISHWMQQTFMDKVPFGFGVYLFFVLSGFLITNILLNLKESITNQNASFGKSYYTFIVRRTLRIFPIYYLTIIFFYLLKSDEVRENIVWLFTYTINIKTFIENVWPSYISHIWTLAVEEQFYIFFPLFIFMIPLKRLPQFFILIIFAALISKQLYFYFAPDRLNSSVTFPLHSFDSLCMGALLSYYSKYNRINLEKFLRMKKLWFILLSVFVFLLVTFYSLSSTFPVNNFFSRTILTFYFSFLCVYLVGIGGTYGFSGKFGHLLELNFIVYIGKISYGIYLYHNFVPTLLNVFQIKTGIVIPHSPLLPLLYLVVTFGIAYLSWNLLESPVNSLRKHFKY